MSAQVPAHTWLRDARAAPTPVSAYLHAAAMVKAGVYLMARAVSAGWAMPPGLAIVLGVMAVVTMFLALSYYFVQADLKRLLAYSTLAHLGYVLLGIEALTVDPGEHPEPLLLFAHHLARILSKARQWCVPTSEQLEWLGEMQGEVGERLRGQVRVGVAVADHRPAQPHLAVNDPDLAAAHRVSLGVRELLGGVPR